MNDWKERLNLIWSRAEIPEYASDVKIVIERLIESLLTTQKKELAEEVEKLDYYWQREHQDTTLITLSDVMKLLQAN